MEELLPGLMRPFSDRLNKTGKSPLFEYEVDAIPREFVPGRRVESGVVLHENRENKVAKSFC